MSRPYDLETEGMNHSETGEMNRVREISHPNSRMKVTLLISKCTRSDYPVNDAITYCWRGGRRRRPEMWVNSKPDEEDFGSVKGHFCPINAFAINPNGLDYCMSAASKSVTCDGITWTSRVLLWKILFPKPMKHWRGVLNRRILDLLIDCVQG